MEIKIKNLVRSYVQNEQKVEAVKDISIDIPSNVIYGIIGKSGAGKSTLVRLISLLEKPDSGEVYYNNNRVDNLDKKQMIMQHRKIGMIFQNFNLFYSRTAAKNIAYPLEICHVSESIIKQRVKELLELVGLSDRADAPISTLSGGQKQRVAIARALANNPDILFCDEATSALDPQTTRSILELIRSIQKKMNLTVVMITHQMEVVRDACEYVSVLNDGMVVESGTVKEIFSNPKSEVTKDFLSHLTSNEDESNKFVRWSDNGGKYIMRFVGNKTGEPVISDVSKKFDVEINILAGGIQRLRETDDVGTLIVDITGKEDEVKRALEYIKEKGVTVELAETAGEEKC
ncbi:MAG: methionine ABC transporter ATP-binding protein [Treponema sp.]|uniref:methionine ABC transporter ATP-binding protein n=1 Tax=Treponema sp. TaxID=166 RepID=UPI001B5DB13B|nr:methionine ABC transporter ATP-binding protein [Treponema sp.]MBP5401689.1 methionine ABC transporter ATP-binding protein [Treponema sp.]MBR5933598.1 methionine ABC transporter ATP-binding protein [Treponema sp.]